jgi:hypothetical protein
MATARGLCCADPPPVVNDFPAANGSPAWPDEALKTLDFRLDSVARECHWARQFVELTNLGTMKPKPHYDPEFWVSAAVHRQISETKLCLASSEPDPCSGPIVRAHTIPRSQLQKLAVEGHVYCVRSSVEEILK